MGFYEIFCGFLKSLKSTLKLSAFATPAPGAKNPTSRRTCSSEKKYNRALQNVTSPIRLEQT